MSSAAPSPEFVLGKEVFDGKALSSIADLTAGLAAIGGAAWQTPNSLFIVDLATRKLVKALPGHTDAILKVVPLQGGLAVASAGMDKAIRIWDMTIALKDCSDAKEACRHVMAGHTSDVYALQELRDGRLASASKDLTIRIWDTDKGVQVQQLKEHTRAVYALAELGYGALLSGGEDKTVRIWKRRASPDHDGAIFEDNAAVIPMSNYVRAISVLWQGLFAVAVVGGTIEICDAPSAKSPDPRLLRRLTGHTRVAYALQPLPDGTLASGSDDKTIRVWDVTAGQCLRVLTGHTNWVRGLTLAWLAEDSDDAVLVSVSEDASARVWALPKPAGAAASGAAASSPSAAGAAGAAAGSSAKART